MNRPRNPEQSRRRALALVVACAAAVAALGAPACAQRLQDFTAPQPLPPDSCLVVGILGGINRWDDAHRPVRKLALDLRTRKLPQVFVETVENRHRKSALTLVRRALDTNRDHKLDAGERASACVILYGQSLGGMAVLKLSRELQALGVPVRLAIEIDSIGAGSRTVPANVARAANFYQRNGPLLRGHAELPLENPAGTRVLVNQQFDYTDRDVDLSHVNPVERAAGGTHIKMEFDPEVWRQVEQLIVQETQGARTGN
jgi:hypothetical protein